MVPAFFFFFSRLSLLQVVRHADICSLDAQSSLRSMEMVRPSRFYLCSLLTAHSNKERACSPRSEPFSYITVFCWIKTEYLEPTTGTQGASIGSPSGSLRPLEYRHRAKVWTRSNHKPHHDADGLSIFASSRREQSAKFLDGALREKMSNLPSSRANGIPRSRILHMLSSPGLIKDPR